MTSAATRPSGRVMIVVSSGATRATIAKARLPAFRDRPFVIAADGGLDAAIGLGYGVDVVVGDLDSVDLQQLAELGPDVVVELAARDKDETDLELAMRAAIARGANAILVLDSARGRVDHFLATSLLYCHADFRDVEIGACIDGARIAVVHAGLARTFEVTPGSTVTLLPINGEADGVTTDGLAFALDHETLRPSSTRGVSNIAVQPSYSISLLSGTLLVIEPEPEAGHE